jgi:hypothetical protein
LTVVCQQKNVGLALAKWRHGDREDVEPVEKVFAETSLANLLFEVPVGGGDNLFAEKKMPYRFNQSLQFRGIVFEHIVVP